MCWAFLDAFAVSNNWTEEDILHKPSVYLRLVDFFLSSTSVILWILCWWTVEIMLSAHLSMSYTFEGYLSVILSNQPQVYSQWSLVYQHVPPTGQFFMGKLWDMVSDARKARNPASIYITQIFRPSVAGIFVHLVWSFYKSFQHPQLVLLDALQKRFFSWIDWQSRTFASKNFVKFVK